MIGVIPAVVSCWDRSLVLPSPIGSTYVGSFRLAVGGRKNYRRGLLVRLSDCVGPTGRTSGPRTTPPSTTGLSVFRSFARSPRRSAPGPSARQPQHAIKPIARDCRCAGTSETATDPIPSPQPPIPNKMQQYRPSKPSQWAIQVPATSRKGPRTRTMNGSPG